MKGLNTILQSGVIFLPLALPCKYSSSD